MLFILLGKHLLLAISRQPLQISTMQSKSMPCMSPMIAQLSSGEMDKFLKCGEIKNKLWHVNSLQTMASNFLATSKQILHLKSPLLQKTILLFKVVLHLKSRLLQKNMLLYKKVHHLKLLLLNMILHYQKRSITLLPILKQQRMLKSIKPCPLLLPIKTQFFLKSTKELRKMLL